MYQRRFSKSDERKLSDLRRDYILFLGRVRRAKTAAMKAVHQRVEKYSQSWADGLIAIVAGATFAFWVTQIAKSFPSVVPNAVPAIAAVVGALIVLAGLLLLWIRFNRLHVERAHFTVVVIARTGFVLWFLVLGLSIVGGFIALVSGSSWPSGIVSAFSAIFLAMGGTAGRPKEGWPLKSLLLLKRIANWQLGAASAIIALTSKVSEAEQDLLQAMIGNPGDSAWPMRQLLLGWVLSAGLLTVLLEPLKYKLESHSEWQLRGWEEGKIS